MQKYFYVVYENMLDHQPGQVTCEAPAFDVVEMHVALYNMLNGPVIIEYWREISKSEYDRFGVYLAEVAKRHPGSMVLDSKADREAAPVAPVIKLVPTPMNDKDKLN